MQEVTGFFGHWVQGFFKLASSACITEAAEVAYVVERQRVKRSHRADRRPSCHHQLRCLRLRLRRRAERSRWWRKGRGGGATGRGGGSGKEAIEETTRAVDRRGGT